MSVRPSRHHLRYAVEVAELCCGGPRFCAQSESCENASLSSEHGRVLRWRGKRRAEFISARDLRPTSECRRRARRRSPVWPARRALARCSTVAMSASASAWKRSGPDDHRRRARSSSAVSGGAAVHTALRSRRGGAGRLLFCARSASCAHVRQPAGLLAWSSPSSVHRCWSSGTRPASALSSRFALDGQGGAGASIRRASDRPPELRGVRSLASS